MNTKTLRRFCAALALTTGLGVFGLFGASCTQPPIQCVVGHGPFIA